MSKFYLLFDSGCSKCSSLASEIEYLSQGLLQTRSLRDKDLQRIITNVKPNWNWEPMLLEETSEGKFRVHSGMQFRLTIAKRLGFKRSLALIKLLNSAGVSVSPVSLQRRNLLKLGLSMAVALGLPKTALAKIAAKSYPQIRPEDILSREGILDVQIIEQNTGLLKVSFTHKDPSLSGSA